MKQVTTYDYNFRIIVQIQIRQSKFFSFRTKKFYVLQISTYSDASLASGYHENYGCSEIHATTKGTHIIPSISNFMHVKALFDICHCLRFM